MIEWIGRLRARIDRWLWGPPEERLPEEIRAASKELLHKAALLDEMVSAMTKTRDEPARR